MLSVKAIFNFLTASTGLLLLATPVISQTDNPTLEETKMPPVGCVFSPWLSCFNADSGKELWRNQRYADPTRFIIHAGQLYISQAGTVNAHNLFNGNVVWSVSTGGDVQYFYPVIDKQNGWIYLARSDGTLEKYSVTSGEEIWSAELGNGWVYPPLPLHNHLITGGQDRVLWVLNSRNGNSLDRIKLEQELVAPLFRAGKLVIASTFDGSLQAWQYDPTRDELTLRWHTRLSTPAFSFSANKDSLIAADMGGRLHSIDLDNGANRWQQQLHRNAFYWNTLHEQRLISLGESGVLFILDAVTGEQLQILQFPGRYDQAPVVRGDDLALYDQTGTVRTVTAGDLHGQPDSQL